MKITKFIFFIFGIALICGCASVRPPILLSEQFNNQIQNHIIAFSVIDARSDKPAFLSNVNKYIRKDYPVQALKERGYSAELREIDTSACGSLMGFKTLADLPCLNSDVFQNGNVFFLVSVDEYTSPKGMNVTPFIRITGVLYSVKTASVLWKDQVSGDFSTANHDTAMYGLAGYFGDLIVKSISPGIILRNNVYWSKILPLSRPMLREFKGEIFLEKFTPKNSFF